MKKLFLIGLTAIACVLPALADPPANVVKPRTSTLVNNQLITNLQTVTFNLTTNVFLTAAYQHNLTLWAQTVTTNIPVNGNTVVSWKFAYDPAGTNFINPGSLTFANTSTTNATGFTNIPPIIFDGATAFELTTAATTGNTNGGNGNDIGQRTSVWLNQTP